MVLKAICYGYSKDLKYLHLLAKWLQVVHAINTAKEAIYNRVSLGHYSFRGQEGEGEE